MKRFSEQLNNKAKTVKLRAAEKNELRERLVSYMEYHPLPAELKSKSEKAIKSPVLTDAFTTVAIPFSMMFRTSAIAAVILLMVVPFMAERAIPGDTLYAVKVQFNEEIVSTLTFDTYQKVEWETERLNRRIAEARLLASEGLLTQEIEAEVAEAVKTHTENAQKEIEVLRTKDADEAAIATIALDTTLQVLSDSLRDSEMDEDDSLVDESSQLTGLIASVIEESIVESEVKNAETLLPAYDKLMAKVEQNTTRVYELLSSIVDSTESTQIEDVTRRIEDVERSVQVAIETASEDEGVARESLVEALQQTQKLIVFMTELQVLQTVDIETLVPVVLTEDEEKIASENLTNELEAKQSQISILLKEVDDIGVLEKVNAATNTIAELVTQMSSTTDFVSFKALAEEGIALADDTIVLLEQFAQPVEVPTDEDASTINPEVGEEPTASSTDELPEEIVEEIQVEEDVIEETPAADEEIEAAPADDTSEEIAI